MTGDNLRVRAYRFAFWEMLEREQPIELPTRTFETLLEGPFKSVTEKENNEPKECLPLIGTAV